MKARTKLTLHIHFSVVLLFIQCSLIISYKCWYFVIWGEWYECGDELVVALRLTVVKSSSHVVGLNAANFPGIYLAT